MYGSPSDATDYFNYRMNSEAWFSSNLQEQNMALADASRRIDRLNFNGVKTNPTQAQSFPRGGDVTVPQDIIIATYELAIALLDGVNPDFEIENLQLSNIKFGPTTSIRDTSTVPFYIRAGIPSATAWSYLLPYLRDQSVIELSRV